MAEAQAYVSRFDVSSAFQRLAVLHRLLRASRLQMFYSDTIDGKHYRAVPELNGGSNNVNAGFGGKYIWIVPR